MGGPPTFSRQQQQLFPCVATGKQEQVRISPSGSVQAAGVPGVVIGESKPFREESGAEMVLHNQRRKHFKEENNEQGCYTDNLDLIKMSNRNKSHNNYPLPLEEKRSRKNCTDFYSVSNSKYGSSHVNSNRRRSRSSFLKFIIWGGGSGQNSASLLTTVVTTTFLLLSLCVGHTVSGKQLNFCIQFISIIPE